jgi:type II secretory pathway component PulJ
MRRLLTSSLAVVAVMVLLPSSVSRQQTLSSAQLPDYQQDARLKTLQKFFEKGDCPAQKYSLVFLEAADTYDLDWRLLPSISFIESTGGKAARNNNLFGWDSGRAGFSSPADSIQTVGYRLSHSELYRNKGTDEILATYNPDAEYAGRVKFVMRQISASE